MEQTIKKDLKPHYTIRPMIIIELLKSSKFINNIVIKPLKKYCKSHKYLGAWNDSSTYGFSESCIN